MAKPKQIQCSRCGYESFIPPETLMESQMDVLIRLRSYKKPDDWSPLNLTADDPKVVVLRDNWNEAIDTALVGLERLYGKV